MTDTLKQRAKQLFLLVTEADPEKRDQILSDGCAGDDELRAEVESLLAHDSRASGSFLSPPQEVADLADLARESAVTQLAPGTSIGKYTAIRLLGEGGMGMVYEASHPEKSGSFAIKVIKPGMDSRAVLERFLFERQTLALLSHPSIANVIDAGAMESGLPYFVMELVAGEPITDYCRANSCSVRERVGLITQLVRGIEHAHCHGVIHRDLKATNVLVASAHGGPSAKIIDFGIARLLSPGGATSWTVEGRLLGTPEYMAPEQVLGSSGADVRSDIYSIGVLLYVLLTDRFPVDPDLLKGLGPSEMHTTIVHARVSRPSARIGDRESARQIRGDLDQVVKKALQPDPENRYSTSLELLADLQRWMNGEPVAAGPTSLWRTLRSTFRRHRLAVSCIAFGILAITGSLIGVTVAWWQTDRARQAEADARVQAESIHEFIQHEMLAAASPEALGLNAPLQMILHDAIRRFGSIFEARPRVEAGVRMMLGETLINCRRADLSVMHWERADQLAKSLASEGDEIALQARSGLARAWTDLGRLDEAKESLEQTLERCARLLTVGDPIYLTVRAQLGHTLALAGDQSGTVMLRLAIESQRAVFGPAAPQVHRSLRWLAQGLAKTNGANEALGAWQDLEALLSRQLGADHPSTIAASYELGRAHSNLGNHQDAIAPLRRVVRARAAALGVKHPNTRAVRGQLIRSLEASGQTQEADAERKKLD